MLPPSTDPGAAAHHAVDQILLRHTAPCLQPICQILRDVGHKVLLSTKPDHDPFEPDGERVNHHEHELNNYDPRRVPGGVAWGVTQGQMNGVKQAVLMPIPHHDVLMPARADTPGRDRLAHSDKTVAFSYYTDADVHHSEFASWDKTNLEEFNKLPKDDQDVLTAAATGLNINDTSAQAIAATRAAARAFAHNVVIAKYDAGCANVMVVFGELTANKPSVPQEMLGLWRKTFARNAANIQQVIYEGGYEGVLAALEERSDIKGVSVQVRIVFHNDTEGDTDAERRGAQPAGSTTRPLPPAWASGTSRTAALTSHRLPTSRSTEWRI